LAGREVWFNTVLTPLRDSAGRVRAVLGVSRDLTERRQTELALQQREEQLRTIQENVPVGLFRTTPDGRFLAVSRTAVRMVGCETEEEVLRLPAVEFYVDPARRDEMMKLITRDGVVTDFEAEIRRRDGSSFPAAFHVQLVTGPDGQPQYFDGVIKDITERRRAREALEESEARYREGGERAIDGIAIIRDGRIVYVNPRLTEQAGMGADDLRGRPFVEFLHPDEREKVADRYRRRLAGEEAPDSYETVFLHSDGRCVNVELKAGLVKYEGEVADLVFIRDVTDRRLAEARLAESEERYRTLFAAAPHPMMVVRDGRCVIANPAAAQLLGYGDPAGLVGVDVLELVAPDERPRLVEHLARLADGKENPETEMRLLARDGSQLPVIAMSRPITLAGQPAVLVVGRPAAAPR
ncbi:MAG: PAS domain S-box protein, partial [bacterium]